MAAREKLVPGAKARVLVVCHANIRRSPMAAAMLRAAGLDGIAIDSAGTHAEGGTLADSVMAKVAVGRGLDLSEHRARFLSPLEIDASAVVLTMEAAQRAAVVRMVPGAVRKTFTIKEFAALAEAAGPTGVAGGSPADRLAALLELAPTLRGQRAAQRHQNDDIKDLRRATARGSQRISAELRGCTDQIVGALVAPSAGLEASSDWSSRHHLRNAAANAAAQQTKAAK